MIVRCSLLFLCATALPATAQNMPALIGRPCLQTGNIAEYHPLPGGRSLVVIDRSHKQYRVDFTAVCEALQIQPDLGFRTFNPSQYACMARGDSVYSSRDVGANRLCRVQTIEYFNERTPEPSLPPVEPPGRRVRG